MRNPCLDLHSTIQEHFEFLLSERGYVAVSEDAGGGNGCAIVMEGNSIRVKFYTAQDEPLNVLVGDASAPLGWAEDVNGVKKWHYLTGIAGYLEGDLAIGERVAQMSREEWSRERRNEPKRLSSLLRGHIVEIERLFSDGEFDLIRDDYDHYRQAADVRTRAALEAKAGRR